MPKHSGSSDAAPSTLRQLLQSTESPSSAATENPSSAATENPNSAATEISAHHTTETPSSASRRLLQSKVAGIDLSIFQISDQTIERIMDNADRNAANFPDKRKVLLDMFDSGVGFSCVIDYGVLLNSIIQRFANFLQRDGWRAKRTCSRAEMRQISTQDILCPVVMKPVERLLYNTNVLIKYYQYMALSSCLQNMSVSCLPPALYQVSGAYESILSVDTANVSIPEVDAVDKDEGDIFSNAIIQIFSFVSGTIGFDYKNTVTLVLAFSSLSALGDDELYHEMTLKNQFSLGRIVRDMLVCDFEDTIYCEKKNIKLLDSFLAMFFVLLVLSFTLPIPSVLYYFMWVLGLSYGVLYLSYNFSPLCFPRIPTCMGSGVYELSQTLLPPQLYFPHALYDYIRCDSQLNLKPEFADMQPAPKCGKSCLKPPFGTGPIMNIIAAIEITLVRDTPRVTNQLMRYLRGVLPVDSVDEYEESVAVILQNYTANVDDYHTALMICILLNSYKLISLLIFVLMLLPFIVKLGFMGMNVALIFLLRTLFIEQIHEDDPEETEETEETAVEEH